MKKKRELPPGLRIREGKYHYRVKSNGSEWTGSTGYAATERNLKFALRKLEEVRQKVETGETHLIKVLPKPFNEAVEMFNDWALGEYKAHPGSARSLKTCLASLVAFFGKTPVFRITPGNLEDYKAWRRSAGIKEITIRHNLHALSKLMQYAIRQNWARRNIAREVKIPSDKEAVRQYVLPRGEEKRYFKAAEAFPDLYDVAKLILLQGLRPDEAYGLRQKDVSLDLERIIIRPGEQRTVKSKASSRVLQLVSESVSILDRRLQNSHEFVFPGRWGRGHIKNVQKQHDKALKKSKTDFVLYDLRHTFATRMAEAGCPLATLAAILGHSNLRTIHRYVHPSRESQFEAMKSFGESGFPSTFRPPLSGKDRESQGMKK